MEQKIKSYANKTTKKNKYIPASSYLAKAKFVNIFSKNINNKYKLVPFNFQKDDVGKTKYYPAASKEWKNNVYSYSSNDIINFPVYDLNINFLIKGYFNLYLNNKFLGHKYISRKSKRKSFNRIFVSNAEIKHTNDKAIITIYVFNKERLVLLKKLK